jgi:hypothetical protein
MLILDLLSVFLELGFEEFLELSMLEQVVIRFPGFGEFLEENRSVFEVAFMLELFELDFGSRLVEVPIEIAELGVGHLKEQVGLLVVVLIDHSLGALDDEPTLLSFHVGWVNVGAQEMGHKSSGREHAVPDEHVVMVH